LLQSRCSQNWQQGGNSAATCGPDLLRVCAPRLGRAGLDVARRRPGAAPLPVRPLAPLRGRPAPRCRPRRAQRQPCARSRGGCGVVRRSGSDGWEDGVDSDVVWIHGHACPPRVDRSGARDARGRSVGGRDSRSERRRRPARSVRVLRHARHERSTGLRRSLDSVASPGRSACCRVCACRRRCVAGGI
jgi:hypothetical protein